MKYLFLFIFFNVCIFSISATTYYVSKNGNNATNNGTIEYPWGTLTNALSKCNSGDTIIIGEGIFTEHSIVINKAITIQGIGTKHTIIQAGKNKPNSQNIGNPVFDIQSEVIINNLTIQHGSPGVKIGSTGNAIINDCNIINCFSETPGSGINVAGNLNLNRSCVAYNTSSDAGGGIFASYSANNFAVVIINNTTISNNQSSKMGGGIAIQEAVIEMKNSTVVYNSAVSKGKGIHFNSSTGYAKVFTNNIIAANGVPDIGANYANSFPAESDIDYNVVSVAWTGYLNLGENSDANTITADSVLLPFIDSIGLQSLADAGSGVWAHAISDTSYKVIDLAGPGATETDLRNAPRVTPDIGAYEFVEATPMTNISIENIDKTHLLNKPILVAVKVDPAYTNENFILSIDATSEAEAQIINDTVIASSVGMLKVWATNNTNAELKDYIELTITDQVELNSLNISASSSYLSLLPNQKLQFYTDVLPKNAQDTSVTWSVSTTEIAEITQDGLFTAKAVGSVRVTATSNSNTEISESITVTIIDDAHLEFTIDASKTLKSGIVNPAGAVLCWLTDSDIERPRSRSMETALSEMKAGALRFPYGALSNNYLWTKNPESIENGLEPCVAYSKHAPGSWDWAVDADGYFRKDQDFDEYVELCRKIGAEPIVCVNIMSHVHSADDDITVDTLIYYAKEWVRYANITKGYNITHWQLGNEQDHHADIYPLNNFKADYKRMAAAMHEVDPTIKTAPGILQHWNSELLYHCPEYVNFLTCHQYLWFGGSETQAYSAWKDYGSNLVPHIQKNQAVLSSANKSMDIFVTETGITGGTYPDPNVFNLYKGLILFEMQMEQIITKNVRNTFYWGTHLPWNGEYGDSPLATLFSNDDANENHMQADVLQAINTNFQSKLVNKTTKWGVVTYSTLSANDSVMTIFVLNKNDVPQSINLSTFNIGTFKTFEKWSFAGKNEFDTDVSFVQETDGQIEGNLVSASLKPYSITVLKMTMNDDWTNPITVGQKKRTEIEVYPNPVNDILHIKGIRDFSAEITIMNLAGQVCKQQSRVSNNVVDVSDLNTGMYILSVKVGNESHVSYFIKN